MRCLTGGDMMTWDALLVRGKYVLRKSRPASIFLPRRPLCMTGGSARLDPQTPHPPSDSDDPTSQQQHLFRSPPRISISPTAALTRLQPRSNPHDPSSFTLHLAENTAAPYVAPTHHVLHDIREQSRAVLPNRVIRYHPLNSIGAFVSILRVELLAELPVLPYRGSVGSSLRPGFITPLRSSKIGQQCRNEVGEVVEGSWPPAGEELVSLIQIRQEDAGRWR